MTLYYLEVMWNLNVRGSGLGQIFGALCRDSEGVNTLDAPDS